MKYINFKMICVLFAVFFAVSCQDDFLDRPSQSEISTENFYQTKEEMRLATAGLYGGRIWGQWNNEAYIPMGDILSGNLILAYQGADLVQLNTFTLSGSNGRLVTCWKGLYVVVAHCNATIKGISESTSTKVSAADKNAAIAEARFIRAMAYYHLVMLWGEVPIIEDNDKLVETPLVNKNKVADGYRFITEDLIFAAENLPKTDVKGRVTSWSAKGMLSKVYLTMAGLGQSGTRNQEYLDLAKNYAKEVIENSGAVLFPSYKDLFRTQFNDSPESLFALQWSPSSSGWNDGNQLLTWSPSTQISPQHANAWGGPAPSYDLYLAFTKQDSIRRKVSFMINGDYYAELDEAGGGYRSGGQSMKKHIIGTEVDNNSPTMTSISSIEHNSLLRLADVYLVYAEAILGNNSSTTDTNALLYFNKVRERAKVDPVTVLDTDVILNERRIEFACEGQYWYDLVRLSYYNPMKALDRINNQKRVVFTYNKDTQIATPGVPIAIINPATLATFTLQLPATEIIANPKLREPSVPYYE